MINRIMAYACETTEEITHFEKLILIALAYHYVEYKEHSSVSLTQIASFCRMTQTTATKYLRSLEDKRIILRLDRKTTRERSRYKLVGYLNQRDQKYQKPVLELFVDYFWKLYPHKTHKQEFLKEVFRMQPTPDEQNAMVAGLHKWIKFWESENIPPTRASKFLGRRLWQREPAHENLS